MKEYRGVPTKRLTSRLGLNKFTEEAPLRTEAIQPKMVSIPLQQHMGAPSIPVVDVGDKVEIEDILAKADSTHLSIPIHASMSGAVKSVDTSIVIERN